MKRLLALASAVGDRVNPVAIKEFRQAVQSRWVISVLLLFLLINLTVIGGYLTLSADAGTSITGGRDVFTGLLTVLLLTCIAFVPAYAGVRLSLERNDTNIDLLFVTTITPGAIVRGKYLIAMALTLLIFSTCMPFMTLTYLLRGIDLPTIFLLLAYGFVVCAVANGLGIFAGSVPGSWFIRGVVGAGVLFCLFFMVIGIIQLAGEMVMYGRSWLGGGPSWWTVIGTYLLVCALAIGLLYVFSVALLSLRPSNRMLVPRLYIMGGWAVAGAVAFVWAWVEVDVTPVAVWMDISGIVFTCLMVVALGERDAWSARVRRRIPGNPLLRLAAFVLYTGSAGGVAWCVLMFAATLLAALAWCGILETPFRTADLVETCGNLSIVFGYFLCYCLTAAFLRVILLRRLPTPGLSVVAGFLAAAALLVPYLIAFFVEGNLWWHALPWYMLGSPMVLSMSDHAARYAAGPIVIGWLVLCVPLSAPWVIGQWERFTPYRAEAP